MKNKILQMVTLLALTGAFTVQAQTAPIKSASPKNELPPKMEALLDNIFNMELMSTGSKKVDYVEMRDGAEKMLAVILKIRQEDKTGKFTQPLNVLATDVQRLHDAAAKQDKRALGYVDKIYESCFECHREHREQPKY